MSLADYTTVQITGGPPPQWRGPLIHVHGPFMGYTYNPSGNFLRGPDWYRASWCGAIWLGLSREHVEAQARACAGEAVGVLYFPSGVRP